MKKIILFFLFTFLCYFKVASQNVQEFGLRFFNRENFGIIYKMGIDDRLTRFSASFVTLDYNEGIDEALSRSHFGMGFSVGREKRSSLHEKLIFLNGPEFGLNVSQSVYYETGNNFISTIFNPSFRYVLGLLYPISEKFLLSAELIPGIGFTHQRNNREFLPYENRLDLGFSSSSAHLTLAYRVIK